MQQFAKKLLTHSQIAQLAEQRTVNPLVVGSSPTLGAMTKANFSTRTNDGQVHHHQEDIQEALSCFVSPDGYRLDIIISNEKVLHIYRDDFLEENLLESKRNHPASSSYYCSDARLVYYHSYDKPEESSSDNVIKVNFGGNSHD